jgi:site-specific DNA-methyltransferase (adenine-specific)
VGDFLLQDFNGMKFDVVVGNPPFQEGGRKDQANKLWPLFVYKSHELLAQNGYMCFITPNSWMQPTADIGKGRSGISLYRDIFRENNLILANINNEYLKQYFSGVGSSFSYFVCQKAKYGGQTKFISEQDCVLDIKDIDVLPKFISPASVSTIKKMIGKKAFSFVDQNHNLNGSESPQKDSVHKYKIYHTNAKNGTYWYGEKKSSHANSAKVIISLSGTFRAISNNKDGFSNMCVAIIADNETKAGNITQVINSKLYRFFIECQKFSGFNPRKAVLSLPEIDCSRSWTDAELYAHFKLTQEEINNVENHV